MKGKIDTQLLTVTIENEINKAINRVYVNNSENENSLDKFLKEGKSQDYEGSYDPDQLRMGIEIEMEHTDDPGIAEKIAKDHLSEFSNYYTALKEMEDKLRDEK